MISLHSLWSLQEANRACPRGHGQGWEKKLILHQFDALPEINLNLNCPTGNIPLSSFPRKSIFLNFIVIDRGLTEMTDPQQTDNAPHANGSQLLGQSLFPTYTVNHFY